ncbi:hypothetical protein EYF80_059117 [Liparis tanakae]|uniref:Uncharacterized protein n=1 Tax=Liparis tanakae TaxID=230148 RepID=A0A4Z2EQ38_9TELE|nr:hypothetical protein EYF80_059117 [Liparis tanakae]
MQRSNGRRCSDAVASGGGAHPPYRIRPGTTQPSRSISARRALCAESTAAVCQRPRQRGRSAILLVLSRPASTDESGGGGGEGRGSDSPVRPTRINTPNKQESAPGGLHTEFPRLAASRVNMC